MTEYQKIPTESEAVERLRGGLVCFPPLTLRVIEVLEDDRKGQYDAVVEASWCGRECLFALEYRSRSTPKLFEETVGRIKRNSRPPGTYPMLMTPYLSPEQLDKLEAQEVSGLDLCGNGIVSVPGVFCVFRTGRPNRYPQSGPIKNIYRGTSSLVPRVFLIKPEYGEVNAVLREIRARNGNIAISTVSKALATLIEDLMISRKNDLLRLIQPDALLDKLAANYDGPRPSRQWVGRWDDDPGIFLPQLFDKASRTGIRAVVSGRSSAAQYAVMARESRIQVYCSNIETILRAAGSFIKENARFANLELIETCVDFVYFDTRYDRSIRWASPVQTFLELMSGDKRERETADQTRQEILTTLAPPAED